MCQALAVQFGRYPDLALEILNTDGLDLRDAGLARAIYGVAIRRWLTIWGVIDPMLSQPRHRHQP